MSDPNILKLVSSNKSFDGVQEVYEHRSNELKCNMKFAVYRPNKDASENLPVLIWLSGLTCNEQNFITKSGFQKYAQEHKIIVVAPDTSPRGCNIDGESERWDFGVGAGFYVDATEPKWKDNFRMYSYINVELHEVIKKNFSNQNMSIFGHSMGGHGALISFFKNPDKYKSVSAFAPISSPSNCPWGKFAFTGYLGVDEAAWKEFDSSYLITKFNGPATTILIDQGADDQFYKDKQLLPERLVEAANEGSDKSLVTINLRFQPGYDHSYYFISSFIEDHIKFHASHLRN